MPLDLRLFQYEKLIRRFLKILNNVIRLLAFISIFSNKSCDFIQLYHCQFIDISSQFTGRFQFIHIWVVLINLSVLANSMRDQPFKRYFPSEKKPAKQSYKYPTYQHYYEPKISELSSAANALKQQSLSAGQIQDAFISPIKKISEAGKENPNKDASSTLKTQLEHLKNQVHKIMEKKQGILRSPIHKRLNSQKQKQPETPPVEDSDNQSVSSEKIFGETKRKLQMKKSTENYDYSKYMELENNLLKTELRNLKNKYHNKKKELSQKCDALEHKVVFLESALFKSEQALTNQVAILKEALRDAQKAEKQSQIPTSDKESVDVAPKLVKAESGGNQSQLFAEKMKSLYDELNIKNKTIFDQEQKIQKIESQLRKYKKESSLFQQKNNALVKDYQQIKTNFEGVNLKLEHANFKIEKLQKINEELVKNSKNIAEGAIPNDIITNLNEEFNRKQKKYQDEKSQLTQKYQKANDQLLIANQQLKYYRQQFEEKQLKISSLTEKYQQEQARNENIELNYAKNLENAQKKHEQLVKSLQSDIYSKISNLTPKKSIKERESSSRSLEKYDRQNEDMQNELKRWKIQYKILKERHESYMKVQNESRAQLKEYYRIHRQSRQKIEVYSHKNKLLQCQFEKVLKLLSEKDTELLKKEIQIRKTSNDAALEKNSTTRQIIALKDRCRALEDKLNEETQRLEKQITYRKEIQQKIFGSQSTDDSLKEVMERMKKRLLQQDEKISKNVKEIKNKQTLALKLKQQLRELMENSENLNEKKRAQQSALLIEKHLKQEGAALITVKNRLEQEKIFMEEQSKKALDEIQTFKLTNYDLNKKMVEISNQLKLISHSYNTKTMEMSQLLSQRSRQLQNLQQRLQETEVMAMSVQSTLREEINAKNDEISLLRKQILSKSSFNSGISLMSGSFDEVLRNQIEGNNKLRQEASKRAEEIYKLRDNCTTLRSQYENTKSENDINKLRFLSQKKNMEVAFQVQVQNYKNIIDNWEKKVMSLEQKMKMIMEQNQKKDQFIKNFIMGKKITQNEKEVLSDFMKQFQISMGSKDIVQRLMIESKIIQDLQKYNESLLKQIALMKEKLVLFEAIDVQKISLYESKLSRRSHQSKDIKDNEQLSELEMHNSRLKKTVSLNDFTVMDNNV